MVERGREGEREREREKESLTDTISAKTCAFVIGKGVSDLKSFTDKSTALFDTKSDVGVTCAERGLPKKE